MEMEVSAKAQNVSLIDKMELIKLRSELKSFEYDFNKYQRKYIKKLLEYCKNSKLIKSITLELLKLEEEPDNTEHHSEVFMRILEGSKCKSSDYKRLQEEIRGNLQEYFQKVKFLGSRTDQLSSI